MHILLSEKIEMRQMHESAAKMFLFFTFNPL